MPSLASTSFATQPANELLVKDAYGKKDNAVVNQESPLYVNRDEAASGKPVSEMSDEEWAAAYKATNPEEFAPVAPADQLSTEKATAAAQAPEVAQANANELSKSLESPVQSALNAMPKTLKEGLTSAMAGVGSAITAVNNGVESVLQNSSMAEVRGVVNAVNAITQGSNLSVRDLKSLAGLGTKLVSQADVMGLPGVYEAFDSAGMDAGVMRDMTQSLLPIATSRGSLPLLSSLSKGSYQNDLKAMAPSLVGEFVQNYQASPTMPQNQLIAEGREMLATFDRIDPQWQAYPTAQGGSRSRTDPFINASPSSQRALGAVSRQVVNAVKNQDPVALITAIPSVSPQTKAAIRAVASLTQTKKLSQTRQRPQGTYGTTRTAKTAVNARISLGQDFPQIGISVSI